MQVKQKKELSPLWSIKQKDPRTQGAAVVFLEQAFAIAENCVKYLSIPGLVGEAPIATLGQAINNYNTLISQAQQALNQLIDLKEKTKNDALQSIINQTKAELDLMKNRHAILEKSQAALDTGKLEGQLIGTKDSFLQYASHAYAKTGALDGNYLVGDKPIENAKDLTDRISTEWKNLPSNKISDEELKNTLTSAITRMVGFLENFVEFPYRLNEMEDILKLSQEALGKAKPSALMQFQTAMREYEKAMVVATEFVADYFKALALTGNVPLIRYFDDFAGLFNGELAGLSKQKPGKHTTEHILHAVAQNKYRNNPALVNRIMDAYKAARAHIDDKYVEATSISNAVEIGRVKGETAIVVFDPNVTRNVFAQLTESISDSDDEALDEFLKED
jgi:CHASE3 domain sensor protein